MTGEPLDLDDVFDALGVERRRIALSALADHQTSLMLPDVAEEVAVRERGVPLVEISAEEVKSIYLDLYHVHIPKLEDIGVIEYHQEKDMVVPTEALDHLISSLHAFVENAPAMDRDRGPDDHINRSRNGG